MKPSHILMSEKARGSVKPEHLRRCLGEAARCWAISPGIPRELSFPFAVKRDQLALGVGRRRVRQNVPMKRPAQPAELATAYDAAGPTSSYVSGATFPDWREAAYVNLTL